LAAHEVRAMRQSMRRFYNDNFRRDMLLAEYRRLLFAREAVAAPAHPPAADLSTASAGPEAT
jgi:hypothetical protein